MSIDTPILTHTSSQQAAVIHLTIPRSDIKTVMGPAIQEVMSAIAAQGIRPAGPVFSHHFTMHPDTFDFEVGVPIAGAIKPAGRVKQGQLPAAKVARTTYRGGYEGLGAAWGEFTAWLRSNNHKTAPDLWECYVAGPESGSDPAKWRTELNRPLTG